MNLDPDTLARATAGNPAALQELIELLQRPLYAMALRMLGQHQDAEDAAQEALLRVVTHLSSFRGESKFSTWVWTIATRVVLDARRRRGAPAIPIEDFEADLADGRDDDARIEDTVLVGQVKLGCGRAMLQVLDDDTRLVYVLGEILEIPGPEVAAALQISPAAFRKRLSRARGAVHETLTRVCGIVNPAAPCRCEKRVRPAQRLARLDTRDVGIDVSALARQMAGIDEASKAAAYYRADPQADAPHLVGLVRRALDL